MIGCGGAVLQDADGKVIHERLIPGNLAAEAVALFKKLGLGMTVILSPRGRHERRWWTPQGFELMNSFIASHWRDESFVALKDSDEVADLPCVGLSCCGPEGSLGPVGDWSAGHPGLRFELVEDPYQKGVQVGFIHDSAASKGEALEILVEHLGAEASETTVFGDAHNDLSMFERRHAWRKVAVDCAVPEIKELADTVLAADDSVLAFIERELAS
jgi:hydroxymethylpyrimidine pyrophosphatase-like HAD family hydrolase